jgi:hypothetical protein
MAHRRGQGGWRRCGAKFLVNLLLRGGGEGATSPSFNHIVQRLFQRGLDPGSHIDC